MIFINTLLALLSHSKNLAIQLAPKGIRASCVAPGSIEFPGGMWDLIRRNNPDQYEAIRRTIPFGRLGTPEEVANDSRVIETYLGI